MSCASSWRSPSDNGIVKAVERAADQISNFDHILWVDVDSLSGAEQGFMHISSGLGFPAKTPEEAVQTLGRITKTWLLVLDNADDPETDYFPLFPPGHAGVVLMTPRNPECGKAYAILTGKNLRSWIRSPQQICSFDGRASNLAQINRRKRVRLCKGLGVTLWQSHLLDLTSRSGSAPSRSTLLYTSRIGQE